MGGAGAMVTAGDCFEGGMASLAMVGSDDSLRQLQRRIERAVGFERRLEQQSYELRWRPRPSRRRESLRAPHQREDEMRDRVRGVGVRVLLDKKLMA